MAYVPPHKRKGNHARSLKAEMLVPMSQKSLNFGAPEPKPGVDRCWKHSYAGNSIYRWLAVGLNGEEADFPNLVLRQVPLELTERMTGVKPLALLNVGLQNDGQVNQDNAGKPWKYITEKILQDLIHSSEFMRNETEGEGLNSKGIRPRLVARVGKVFFVPGRSSTREEDPSKVLVDESLLRQTTRNFYTNVPASYTEVIVNEVVPKVHVEFQYLKDVYYVKLSDKFQPEASVMCKCRLVQDRLELYKIEMNQIRHMVYDISCIEKNLDLRIMLSTQRTLTALHDDEVESIRNLIASAVLDTCCKGGLRWPFGKATSSEGRYQLSGVGHTISRVYESPSLRLKVLDADRFDFKTSFGETTDEITLKLKGVLSALLGKQLGINSVSDMLEDTLKLLWEHFLPSVPLVM